MSESPQPMTLEDKLDEALKETFPASDAFWLAPENALPSPTKKKAVA